MFQGGGARANPGPAAEIITLSWLWRPPCPTRMSEGGSWGQTISTQTTVLVTRSWRSRRNGGMDE